MHTRAEFQECRDPLDLLALSEDRATLVIAAVQDPRARQAPEVCLDHQARTGKLAKTGILELLDLRAQLEREACLGFLESRDPKDTVGLTVWKEPRVK
jgi:hypothetical protein